MLLGLSAGAMVMVVGALAMTVGPWFDHEPSEALLPEEAPATEPRASLAEQPSLEQPSGTELPPESSEDRSGSAAEPPVEASPEQATHASGQDELAVPSVRPAPKPRPSVEASPEPAPSVVTVTGDATSVTFTRGDESYGPGPMPAGHYLIHASFEGLAEATVAGTIDVAPGQELQLRCTSGFDQCKAE